MATVNLGRIKPVFRGAYSGATAYIVDDIVTHGDESFICIQAHGAGTQATSVTAYWTKLAAKGTDGTDVGTTITTQGDILYRDGSGLQRLAKGTASQTLAMNSGATAPEWITASSGGILQVKQSVQTATQSITGNSSTWNDATNLSVSITPAATGNKILIFANMNFGGEPGYGVMMRMMRDSTPIYITTAPASNQKSATWSTILHNAAGNATNTLWNVHQTFLDNPSTTSATTYKLQWLGEATEVYYINRRFTDADNSYSSKATSSITIMEVASGAL